MFLLITPSPASLIIIKSGQVRSAFDCTSILLIKILYKDIYQAVLDEHNNLPLIFCQYACVCTAFSPNWFFILLHHLIAILTINSRIVSEWPQCVLKVYWYVTSPNNATDDNNDRPSLAGYYCMIRPPSQTVHKHRLPKWGCEWVAQTYWKRCVMINNTLSFGDGYLFSNTFGWYSEFKSMSIMSLHRLAYLIYMLSVCPLQHFVLECLLNLI